MSAALDGGESIGASIAVLLEKLVSSEVLSLLRAQKLDGGLLKRLSTALQTINLVFNDADVKQIIGGAARQWLEEIQDALYDFDDLVDDISTEHLRFKLEAESKPNKTQIQVLNFILRFSDPFKKRIRSKVVSVTDKLEYLAKQKHDLLLGAKQKHDLLLGEAGLSRESVPTTSLVEEYDVYGRDGDKEKIIQSVLGDAEYGDPVFVIPIVGMGGVGKTTLAQLVYTDERVRQYFELLAWVCVSDEFDVLRVTSTIFEAITCSACDIKDLNVLQIRLKEMVREKAILLVLDDIWNENYLDWVTLRAPFAAAMRCKIIVTTRNNNVASMMGSVPAYHLQPLPDEDCWLLVKNHAFHNSTVNPDLEIIGRSIVKKCEGLPLAIKTLGGLLRNQLEAHRWDAILRSFSWGLQNGESDVLLCLKLSYHYLPAYLKQCFAYCSIFPKDYEFEKEKLVLLWMAEDFVPQTEREGRMEEVGGDCFDDLLSRSFFQQLTINESCFGMHDLMNDLAQYVSGEFYFRLDNEKRDISKKARHLSYSGGNYDAFEKLKVIYDLKYVRTFLALETPPDFKSGQLTDELVHVLLLTQRRLRVLSLSHSDITELPDSIGALKHLRYLDLSHTAIKRMPESVSTLYNLQTLILSNCGFLTTLPRNMGRLLNLRHLNIGGTSLIEMPSEMGRLKSLQTLTSFIVGKYSGSRINELGGLLYLHGALSILKLQNVVDAKEALVSNLKHKEYLEELALEWSGDRFDMQNDSEVLEMLQPHTNLKKLTIRNYGGTRFPHWLGKPSYSNMVFIHLSHCNRCQLLPPLGQLPSLKDLIIEGINGVEKVGREFCGTNVSAIRPFQSLQTLRFVEMTGWVEWISFGPEHEEFPSLQELYIQRCPKLVKDLPKQLPSLKKLEISECQELVASLPKTPVSCELQLHKYNKVPVRSHDEHTLKSSPHMYETSKSNITHEATTEPSSPVTEISEITHETASKSSSRTEISDISYEAASQSSSCMTEIPNVTGEAASQSLEDPIMTWYNQDMFMKNLSSLESLKISEISQLKDLPPSLHSLRIEECDALESLPEEMTFNHPCLEHLYIISCYSLKSFPGDGPPTTLKTLYVHNCRNLEFSLPTMTMHQYALLERLCIGSSCDSLTSFPLCFFPKLRTLCIWDCANLESISILEGLRENLKSLDAFEIRDCPKLVSFPKRGLRAPNLTSIWISNCKNLESLPERMHNLLPSLQVLSISKCPSLVSFPEGGLPSNLNFLCITFCIKLTPRMEWGMHRMESLSHFEIEGGCSSLESFPMEGLLPTSLISLCISRLLNLKRLDYSGLQHLTSLETLEINCCNKLRSFPEEGLPTSLSYLIIKECSFLKIRYQRDKGVDWPKIAHIPHIDID